MRTYALSLLEDMETCPLYAGPDEAKARNISSWIDADETFVSREYLEEQLKDRTCVFQLITWDEGVVVDVEVCYGPDGKWEPDSYARPTGILRIHIPFDDEEDEDHELDDV